MGTAVSFLNFVYRSIDQFNYFTTFGDLLCICKTKVKVKNIVITYNMGKKKNKNKVSGAVKTALKTEKKLAKKLQKELGDLGEVSAHMLFMI